MLFVLFYISALEQSSVERRFGRQKLWGWALGIAVFLNITSFQPGLARLDDHTKNLAVGIRNWAMVQDGSRFYNEQVDSATLKKALEKKIYRLPCESLPLKKQHREKWCG